MRYTGRGEEDVDAHYCRCCKSIESKTHIVRKCELYKEERDVLEEEIGKLHKCDTIKFGTSCSSGKTIAVLGGKWWSQIRGKILLCTRNV
ncbi:unnamed protein product [Sphacelaria rigidula]